MSKKNCELIRDLLPLYADGVCSELSKKTVTEHLAECKECAAELDKMNRKITVEADKDISAIRKIKKRMRLVKVAAATIAAILVAAGLFAGYMWAITDCTMDYEKYNLAENVRVEKDSDDRLWLCIKGKAAAYSAFVWPTISDTDGNHFGTNQPFNKDKKAGRGYTLKMFRLAKLLPWEPNPYEERIEVKLNDDSPINYVFYYDDVTDTEYVLWKADN
ncbi:MAG: zf-HC2 domain-containing protein [Oscillospiraceae bacterium]|nr:zf-HC2 domain-containing protein [Oscillospiraceae bacterium]MBR3447204.1 zf-HC2 domain-containing protein [Oscillospiraceae bacterium]